ncbi:hypothetical protein AX14_013830 [Amanita brunnescens Koide BX004]|nr:hypothetical protein AX14_013830 [Amanita brunnescens Koide BX004]
MKFTAFGSVLALALIGLAAAAPPGAADANPATHDTHPSTPGTTSTQPKTDPAQGSQDCVPSQCKAGNKNPGDVFCGNQAIDPSCLNGHLYKADSNGLACDLGLDNSC